MTSGGGESAPQAGYYADPSIPGYIRYWNGSSWVPGTSRPEPLPGEVLTPPPGAVPAAGAPRSSAPPPSSPASGAGQPARSPQEPGPVFLDENGGGEGRRSGAAGEGGSGAPARWSADASRQGQNRISWGQSGQPAPSAQGEGPQGDHVTPATASADRPEPKAPAARSGGEPQGRQSVPWAQQVQQLARQDAQAGSQQSASQQPAQKAAQPLAGPPAPRSQTTGHVVGQTFADNALAWRPPPSNPFLQASQVDVRPAPVGRRLIARIVDTVLVGAALGAAGAPLALAAIEHIEAKIDEARLSGENVQVWLIDGTTGMYLGIFLAAFLLIGFLYEVLPTAKWGRTVGKRLVKVKVLDIESQETTTVGRSLGRWLVHQVLGMLGIGILNVMWCLFDRPWRQCWHDKSARTFVAVETTT